MIYRRAIIFASNSMCVFIRNPLSQKGQRKVTFAPFCVSSTCTACHAVCFYAENRNLITVSMPLLNFDMAINNVNIVVSICSFPILV